MIDAYLGRLAGARSRRQRSRRTYALSKLARLIYSLVFYLLLPAIFSRQLWRSFREPEYRRRWAERLGWFPGPVAAGSTKTLWVHSVSAGETIAAVPLIRRLLTRYPDLRIVVTTMTPAGSDRVSALLGTSVEHSYAPYDVPGAVKRFLGAVVPSVLIIIDTELWPNILHECRRRRIETILVNGRLSARSARGYARISTLTREMLGNLSHLAVQAAPQGRRFVELGLDPSKLSVTGSIKYDLQMPDDLAGKSASLADALGGSGAVLVAASTHEGEEAAVLEAFQRVVSDGAELRLVLVPRHPDRFERVWKMVTSRGLKAERFSQGLEGRRDTQVTLVDAMGELLYFYAIADIAFVGGSLVPVGGHNMLEAAHFGLPVIMGPHVFKVEEMTEEFRQVGALRIVADTDELASLVAALAGDEETRLRMGDAARRLMAENQGSLDRVCTIVERHLPPA